MKLPAAFYRLPFRFDAECLRQEVEQFEPALWMPHPNNHPGNTALPLISLHGEDNNFFHGEMKETAHLASCEYTRQVLASFDEVFGRSRFMRLDGGHEVPLHVDTNYHWHSRVRIHVPVITDPEVIFHCGDEAVHMAAGECWIFDAWRLHKVVNASQISRVHLVFDTAGSSRFWQTVRASYRPDHKTQTKIAEDQFISFQPNKTVSIATERYNTTPIKSPGEVDGLIAELLSDIDHDSGSAELIVRYTHAFEDFRHDWRALFLQYGYETDAVAKYNTLINNSAQQISAIEGDVLTRSNGQPVRSVFFFRVFDGAVARDQIKRFSVETDQSVETNQENESDEKLLESTGMMLKQADKPYNKVSRNAACPCGSRKKYKHCHGQN
jgi:hypothetical protein